MNDVDVRDERLADLLDRAVRDVEPTWGSEPSAGGHRGGRVTRVVAAAMTAAVFVGAIAWAATQVGSKDGGPVTYGSLEGDGWTLTAPADWASTPLGPCEGSELVSGVIVASVDLAFQPGHPSCEDVFIAGSPPAGLPLDGVAVSFEPEARRTDLPVSDTPFPLTRDTLMRSEVFGRDLNTFNADIVIGRETIAQVWLWIGPDATVGAISEAEHVLASIDVVGAVDWETYRDAPSDLTVTHPEGWVVAEENLTPWLASPGEILSLGTFPLRVSTHPEDGLRLFDAPVAPAALEDMTEQDAFVSVQEGDYLGGADQRPATFRRDDCAASILGCGQLSNDVPFQAWWIPFVDEGRAFYLFVAIGNDASPELVEQTWAVADSLTFYPA